MQQDYEKPELVVYEEISEVTKGLFSSSKV